MKYAGKLTLLPIICMVLFTLASAQPTMNSATILENNDKYGKLEIGIEVSGNFTFANPIPTNYINPYDWDQVRIDVHIVHNPTQKTYNIHGFYYLDFQQIQPAWPYNTPLPSNVSQSDLNFLANVSTQYNFRSRFSPDEVGDYHAVLKLYYQNTYVGSQELDFDIAPSNNKGFIRRNYDNTYVGTFKYDDGTPYFPTGTNTYWYEWPVAKFNWEELYLKTIDRLHQSEGNYARVLMGGDQWSHNNNGPAYETGFIFGLEWGTNANLGNYDEKQHIAFLLDELVDYSKDRDVNLQLALYYNGELSTDPQYPWYDHNPYKQILGNNPNSFYTDPLAIKLWKQKLRYIISRWGYATNIFAWEIMGEFELSYNVSANTLVNWIANMCQEIKTLDPNHMITASSAYEWFDTDPNSKQHQVFSLNDIDFLDHHTYETSESYNFAHYRREETITKINYYNKPCIAGEFGQYLGGKLNLYEFNNSNLYRDNEFHNGIWSSSFSGASGTSSFWWRYVLHEERAWPHIKPLRVLINEMDLTRNFIPISSDCGGVDDVDLQNHLNMSSAAYNYFNSNPGLGWGGLSTCPQGIYNQDIQVYTPSGNDYVANNIPLLVLGLKSDDDIFGWMHKKDNFWWKLPHAGDILGGGYYLGNCAYNSNPATSPYTLPPLNSLTPNICNNFPLEDAKAVFSGVCNGIYEISYYSAYPGVPLTVSGSPANGGIIPGFTRKVYSTNNSLDVKVPTLKPFDPTTPEPNTMYAPDYGYHIKKLQPENYHDVTLSNIAFENTTDNIETCYINGAGNTKIFYRGNNDNLIHYYLWDLPNSQWVHGLCNPYALINPPAIPEIVDGDIALNNSSVFYRGVDSRIHVYHYSPNAPYWIPDCVPAGCNSPSNENIAAGSVIEATDDQLFYAATDGKIHMYYFDLGLWHHVKLNPSASSLENSTGDIKVPENNISNSDIVFFRDPWFKLCTYTRNGTNSSPWTFDIVGVPSSPDEEVIGTIQPVYISNELYCFYTGYDHYVQFYKQTSSGWQHGYISNDPSTQAQLFSNLVWFDNTLYWAGTNGYMHRYYWDNAEWRLSTIVNCPNSNGDAPWPNTPNHLAKFRITVNNDAVNFVYPNHFEMRIIDNLKNCELCPDNALKISNDNSNNPDINSSDYLEKVSKGVFNTHTLENTFNTLPGNSNTTVQLFESKDKTYRLAIYPNPAADKINILLNNVNKTDLTLDIVNTIGSKVKKVSLSKAINNFTIDVSNFPRGLYYFNITEPSGKVITTQKVSLY